MSDGSVIVVGGTGGIGREVARHYRDQGKPVVITGRDPDRAVARAAEIGDGVTGLGFDLAEPGTIAGALSDVGPVSRLVLLSIDRDNNPISDYDYERALYLTTMKLVGYTETIHSLSDRFTDDASVLLFGGRAKDWPYPGSTTVTTVNGGIQSMIRTLAIQLKPVRFNAIHPGIVGDSPYWEDKAAALDAAIAKTPTGKLATMADVVGAASFLLENPAMNATDLYVDGGWMLV
jgi:NAD(P)-dependent dehydrogenase (short-subunit alcohol dehydrogenase family)